MGKKLYVSHISGTLDRSALEDLFTTVGDVETIDIPMDPVTGARSTFAFVEMFSEQQALDCISRFHGRKVLGQTLAVVEDIPRVMSTVQIPLKKKRTRKPQPRLSSL